MSQQNVALVHAAFVALNKGDVPTLLDLLDADIELNSTLSPLEGAFRGHQGVRAYFASTSRSFESLIWELERVAEVDDERVIAHVHARGRGTASGVGVDQHVVNVFRVRGGKVLRVDSYMHESEALEAVGLPE